MNNLNACQVSRGYACKYNNLSKEKKKTTPCSWFSRGSNASIRNEAKKGLVRKTKSPGLLIRLLVLFKRINKSEGSIFSKQFRSTSSWTSASEPDEQSNLPPITNKGKLVLLVPEGFF